MQYKIGIDVGGTFTDFVRVDARGLTVYKLRTTPDDPSRAILEGIAHLSAGAPAENFSDAYLEDRAGMLAALYSIPASLFRAYGGYLSDRYGARAVMYWTFGISLVCLLMLSYPDTDYVIHGIEGPIAFSTQMALIPFVITIFILGFFMSLGKAAVYKFIPIYYPEHVGSVGGLVGMIGGLGGFVLPIAFGVMADLTNIWTSCFMLLFFIVAVSLAWMVGSIRLMEYRAAGEVLAKLPQLPELEEAKHAQASRQT